VSEEQDNAFIARFRKNREKILADGNERIAQADYNARIRPDVAPHVNPDSIADAYVTRRWAQQALAALDRGKQIPPHPGN
jgi:hypothetical protein